MRTDIQTQVAPNSTVAQPASFNSGMVALTLLLPLILIASAIGYRRYRSARLRQQIESLERIWKMTYRKTRS